MKTARITFLVELGDFNPFGSHIVTQDRDSTFAVRLEAFAGCQIIGEPTLEIDNYHRCSMSEDQFHAALRNMRELGGSFVRALAVTLVHADSGHREKLCDAFHDLIWSYIPESQE